MYALGVTALHGGDLTKANVAVRELGKPANTRGEQYWRDMLQAEWAINQSNYPLALKILGPWQQSQPARLMPMKLLLQLYQKTGKSAAAQAMRTKFERQSAKQPFSSTAEGMASPLGVMALAKRPVE
jgi:uncharacterized protein HemY